MKTREQALIVRRFLRRTAIEGGEQTRVFAKLWLAEYEERGIRLTADEVPRSWQTMPSRLRVMTSSTNSTMSSRR